MKIALIGYGKMGKTIENIAIGRGHEVVLRLDVNNPEDFEKLPEADVAIEFTRPESAVGNLEKCIAAGVPVVCGTTGWLKSFDAISLKTKEQNSGFFYASNYSIGVNIFFEINRKLAEMMQTQPQYDVKMTEVHHTQKLDAPSGTAISLAQGILQSITRKDNWICPEDTHSPNVIARDEATEGGNNSIVITAKRIDPAPGIHIVTYDSPIDTIEISHTAHSREGFATGAVLAAEWLVGKKGVFSMKDMLGF
jgi:4-hydroxy-tetrahydrodipicolinate reductase